MHPLACEVMVCDWRGPHHASGLHGELDRFLAVCPRGHGWGATATKKTECIMVVDRLVRHAGGLGGDDGVRCVKSDAAPEFIAAPAVSLSRACKIDCSINCPAHHGQTGAAERGHSTHQDRDSMRTMGSYANSARVLWGPEFLLSAPIHKLKLRRASHVSPYSDLRGTSRDTHFVSVWGCFAVLHQPAVNPHDWLHPRGLPCVYAAAGYLDNVRPG